MRFNQISLTVILAASSVLVGCQSSRLGALNTQPVINSPAPLAAAPSGTVTQNTLDPVGNENAFPEAPQSPVITQPTVTSQPLQDETVDVASASGGPITREQMIGAWKVSTGGSSCQIFLALTQWSGGFRAASRGCPGAAANITAWNVDNNQVLLKDSGGNNIATLISSGPTRYSGAAGGAAITLSR